MHGWGLYAMFGFPVFTHEYCSCALLQCFNTALAGHRATKSAPNIEMELVRVVLPPPTRIMQTFSKLLSGVSQHPFFS